MTSQRKGSERMSMQSHLAELERRHRALKAQIEKEMHSPASDDAHVLELKKKKLQLKDEITRLKADATVH
jgi:hypothetical protein